MLPEICKIGFFTIYSYGLMLVLAFFVSTYLVSFQAKKEQVDPEKIFNLCFYIFILGVIGARIFYLLSNINFYLHHPLEIIMLQHGGLSWFGGLIFGSVTAVIIIKKNKIDLLKTLDLLIPFIALGQAIGRIGCFLNGCCFGGASKFGIYFKTFNQVLIPTQLYSSLSLVLIFIILRWMQEKKHLPGQIICSYLFLYSLKRFFIEFFRNDTPKMFYGLTLFQILSLAMFISSFLMFAWIFCFKKK